MGITKTDGFSSETTTMADILKAMGHPARLKIIKYLSETNTCIGNEIVDVLPLAQPTISRHLSELKKVGLVQGTISGSNMNYCINKKTWNAVKELIMAIDGHMCDSENCC